MESFDDEVMLRVARAYYLEDRSKVQIAEETELSRWQVARLLTSARTRGFVRIHVGDPSEENEDLSRRLAKALSLRSTVVISRADDSAHGPTIDGIGRALAGLLAQEITAGQTIGLTWSRAIEAMTHHLDVLPPCDVVQLAGALTFTGDRRGSVEVVRHTARVSGGTAHPMYAPLFLENLDAAAALRRQPDIAECLERVSTLDVAILSVGTWEETGSALYPIVPTELAEAATAAGAVGELSGRVFDADGQPVSRELDDRVIGASLAELRDVPEIIASSYGAHRAAATIAAARAGLMDVLVADEPLAQAILAQKGR
ncbi:sugar-binding transcriptional regulator [Microbacterium panaciterrae]|uniref:Sugar-binding domain-containing protein n=1 Tax=Microbacterium panaciterrae TaxID=985759 RepID=A0ABP8PND9_9MICO